jgi:TPR repeat protein
MEEVLRQELLAKTKRALDANDWRAVVALWQPWVERGDPEAEYQLAYNYLWCSSCDDDATYREMEELLRRAAAKNHADAIWFLATREKGALETSPEFERELLRAGQLGSIHAQGVLGVMYETGNWSGPKDLAEAARWYRLAAEKGNPNSQFHLGYMLLLGEGVPKNLDQGLMWLERAAAQEEFLAFAWILDCYENGDSGVPIDAAKAQHWRSRLEEYERLHPLGPRRSYSIEGSASQSSLDCLSAIEGVTGFSFIAGNNEFTVFYETALITPAELDDKVQYAVLSASPIMTIMTS